MYVELGIVRTLRNPSIVDRCFSDVVDKSNYVGADNTPTQNILHKLLRGYQSARAVTVSNQRITTVRFMGCITTECAAANTKRRYLEHLGKSPAYDRSGMQKPRRMPTVDKHIYNGLSHTYTAGDRLNRRPLAISDIHFHLFPYSPWV